MYTYMYKHTTSKKSVEHLINSYELLLLITEKKTEAVNAYLIMQQMGKKEEEKGVTRTSSRKVRRTGRS